MGIVMDLCEICVEKDEDEPDVWAISTDEKGEPTDLFCVEHGVAAKLLKDPFDTALGRQAEAWRNN